MAYVYQRSGENIVFDFSFNANQPQAVQIFLGGAEVANRNSLGDKSTFAPGPNTTDNVFQYTVRGLYKHVNDGKHPWNPSWERQLPKDGNKIVIGFEDMTADGRRDGDYDDAVVTVSYVQ